MYIALYSEEFGITPTKASDLVSYPNLAFGFGTSHTHLFRPMKHKLTFQGSLILVPLYLKIGRRPVMLLSMVLVRTNLGAIHDLIWLTMDRSSALA